jgi:hypothetical protein
MYFVLLHERQHNRCTAAQMSKLQQPLRTSSMTMGGLDGCIQGTGHSHHKVRAQRSVSLLPKKPLGKDYFPKTPKADEPVSSKDYQ